MAYEYGSTCLTSWQFVPLSLFLSFAPRTNLFGEIYDIIWQGTNVRGELMFLEGWRLRGNPDSIFDLPEPE
jgi:hypothetical protein